MFKKIGESYNQKIEYKMLYFLNPKLDTSINYYETLNIYNENVPYISEQGKWFVKIKKVYMYLLNNELNLNELFNYASKEFETESNHGKINEIKNNLKYLEQKEITYYSSWFLKEILRFKPLYEKSYILGILIFNAILRKQNYVPMIFMPDYVSFVQKIIDNGVTLNSLRDILYIYEDLSFKYEKKYDHLTKNDIFIIIKKYKEVLINNYDLKNVWLYGSFVRNEATDFSDIDLYVEFKKNKSNKEIQNVKKFFEAILGRIIDIQIEHKEPNHFSNNGLIERELIFNDSE